MCLNSSDVAYYYICVYVFGHGPFITVDDGDVNNGAVDDGSVDDGMVDDGAVDDGTVELSLSHNIILQ